MPSVFDVPPGWRLLHLAETGSTNDIAKEKAHQGEPEGLVVVADRQSAGRGRHSREWVSPAGNLYCSLLLRPGGQGEAAGQLALVAGVALLEALEPLVPPKTGLSLKWPNDVLLEGRKLAGILLEGAFRARMAEYVVVGVGVNVESHPKSLPYPAESLKNIGSPATRQQVLSALLERLGALYARWQAGEFAAIREIWLSHAAARGEKIQVRLQGGARDGIFEGVDESGALLLRTPAGVETILAGDVFF